MKMSSAKRCAGLVAAGAVFLVWNGCSRPGPTADDGDHAHEGEVKTAQITVFGERHEIFAEHRLVVAGTPTKFVTHVTGSKTGEPRARRRGAVQMRLDQEPPAEQAEQAPSRAGIYEAMLTFPKVGIGASPSSFRQRMAKRPSHSPA